MIVIINNNCSDNHENHLPLSRKDGMKLDSEFYFINAYFNSFPYSASVGNLI